MPDLGERHYADPATPAHTSFFTAAGTESCYAGIGALLLMVWFNAEVSDHLKDGAVPGSSYLPWIGVYHPGESYAYAVRAFLDVIDRAGESRSAWQRQLLVEQFSISIRYEWVFAECCLRQPSWPV